MHGLVAAAAARFPDAVAVSAPEGQLTYAGLAERAGRLAAVLSGAGAGPETVVGLCLPRGLDMVDRGAGGVVVRGGVPAA